MYLRWKICKNVNIANFVYYGKTRMTTRCVEEFLVCLTAICLTITVAEALKRKYADQSPRHQHASTSEKDLLEALLGDE